MLPSEKVSVALWRHKYNKKTSLVHVISVIMLHNR